MPNTSTQIWSNDSDVNRNGYVICYPSFISVIFLLQFRPPCPTLPFHVDQRSLLSACACCSWRLVHSARLEVVFSTLCSHSHPQRPRSFWSSGKVLGIETKGRGLAASPNINRSFQSSKEKWRRVEVRGGQKYKKTYANVHRNLILPVQYSGLYAPRWNAGKAISRLSPCVVGRLVYFYELERLHGRSTVPGRVTHGRKGWEEESRQRALSRPSPGRRFCFRLATWSCQIRCILKLQRVLPSIWGNSSVAANRIE